jgi:hypothetical protein
MAEIIRNASIWVGGVKVATAQSGSYDSKSNAVVAVGDGAIIGATQAPHTGQIDFKAWMLIGGDSANAKLQDAHDNNKYITVNYGIDGGYLRKVLCIITDYKSTTDMSSGKTEGDFTCQFAGKPVRI